MPGFIKPQLATLKSKAPKGDQWLHEIKYDGYRIQVHLNRGRKKVFTRTGLDWTKRFTEIAGALAIPGEAIFDGEVMVIHEGRANFSELQAELAAGRQGRLVYYAFDLLWRNGDLRKLPQIERKQLLLDLLGENDVELPVLYSEHLTGGRRESVRARRETELGRHHIQACRRSIQVGARRFLDKGQDDPAREVSGRRIHQRSLRRRRTLSGQARRQRAALHRKVGTRWSRTVSSQIRKQLDAVVSPKSKLTRPIRQPKATWVEPKFFADVEYWDITSEGLLRASSFKGLSRK
jgi:bifunctional non-homologous end joining protein LigD